MIHHRRVPSRLPPIPRRPLVEPVERRQLFAISFLPAVQSQLGALSVSTVGDFTGDRAADLVARNAATGQVQLFPGLGDGHFVATATAAAIDAGPNVVQLVTADVNFDGRLDLVAVNARSSSNAGGVTVLLGQGGLSFAPPRRYAAGPSPTSVAVGDFNRDGRPDLGVANDEAWPASSPNAPGTYGAGILFGTNAGFDAVRQRALQGPTTAAAAAPPTLTAANVTLGATLSFAGPNLLVLTPIPVTNVYVIGPAITTTPSGMPPVVAQVFASGQNKGLAMADLNRDGRPDVAALQALGADISNPLAISVHSIVSGVPTPTNSTTAPPPTYTNIGSFATGLSNAPQFGIAAADFDRDGRPDVAVAGIKPAGVLLPAFQNGVAVLPGLGLGKFAAARFFNTGGQTASISIGDANRDGKTDIVAAGALGASTLLNTSKSMPTTFSVRDQDPELDLEGGVTVL